MDIPIKRCSACQKDLFVVDPETGNPMFYAGHGKCVPCYKAHQKARREVQRQQMESVRTKIELQKDFDRLVETYGPPDHLKGTEGT